MHTTTTAFPRKQVLQHPTPTHLIGGLCLLQFGLVAQGLGLESLYGLQLLLHGVLPLHAQLGQGGATGLNVRPHLVSDLGELDSELFVLLLPLQLGLEGSVSLGDGVQDLAPLLVQSLVRGDKKISVCYNSSNH